LKDFVKYGKSEACTEIELFNPSGQNPVIQRHIHRDKNSSTWTLNGKSSQLKEVRKLSQILLLSIFLPGEAGRH